LLLLSHDTVGILKPDEGLAFAENGLDSRSTLLASVAPGDSKFSENLGRAIFTAGKIICQDLCEAVHLFGTKGRVIYHDFSKGGLAECRNYERKALFGIRHFGNVNLDERASAAKNPGTMPIHSALVVPWV
jgi:hypothetical protein